MRNFSLQSIVSDEFFIDIVMELVQKYTKISLLIQLNCNPSPLIPRTSGRLCRSIEIALKCTATSLIIQVNFYPYLMDKNKDAESKVFRQAIVSLKFYVDINAEILKCNTKACNSAGIIHVFNFSHYRNCDWL